MPICYKAAAIGQSLIDGQEVHNCMNKQLTNILLNHLFFMFPRNYNFLYLLYSNVWHVVETGHKIQNSRTKRNANVKKVDSKFVKKVMKQYVKKYGKIKKRMSTKEKRADKESMEAFVCFFFVQNLRQMKT